MKTKTKEMTFTGFWVQLLLGDTLVQWSWFTYSYEGAPLT